ncbi:MAG: hypothetical protein WC588_00850 [Candidatus Micrarchaeia archaeon]
MDPYSIGAYIIVGAAAVSAALAIGVPALIALSNIAVSLATAIFKIAAGLFTVPYAMGKAARDAVMAKKAMGHQAGKTAAQDKNPLEAKNPPSARDIPYPCRKALAQNGKAAPKKANKKGQPALAASKFSAILF